MTTAQVLKHARDARGAGLTVDQYHRMIASGEISEGAPIELLDGVMLRKDRSKAGEDLMSVGIDHAWAVDNLATVLAGVGSHGCFVRLQFPVTLPPDGEPEPDAAIVRGQREDYLRQRRHPGAADAPCVIEVADSSLNRDRTTKLRIYAEGGIGQYVIVNLVERIIEVYERPVPQEGRYDVTARKAAGEDVAFSCGEGRSVPVAVAALLPPGW